MHALAPVSSASSLRFPLKRVLIGTIFMLTLQSIVGLILYFLYWSQPDVTTLNRAQAQELPSANPVLIRDEAWQSLALPEKLCRSECTSQFKVYRIELGALPTLANQALYVRMFDGSLAAYLNGSKIGQTGSMQAPIADMTYQPAYFDIPDTAWSSTSNTLDIVVASIVKQGGRLTAPFIGDSSELKFAYRTAHGLTVDALGVINGILLMFLFAAILLYFSAERDALFMWFAALLLFCVFRNLNVLLPEWPANSVIRNGIYLCATLGVLFSSGGFVNRLGSRHSSRLDRVLIGAWPPISIAIFVGLSLDMATTWSMAVLFTRVLTLTLGTWVLVRFVLYSKGLNPLAQGAVFALLGAAFTLMLHDTIGSHPPRILLYQTSNLAALPVVLCFCVVLAHRFRESFLRISNQNQRLATAVADKENELRNSYKMLGEARDAQILAEERQRIMQDMHDGVGGKLAALLQRLRLKPSANNADLTRDLQSSLNDLRLIIDSLDVTTSGNLGFALGTFRQRVEPWLTENGVTLKWQFETTGETGENLSQTHLSSDHTLQVYRILQESLNNVVRHANATRVAIDIRSSTDGLCLRVSDNGRGMASLTKHGRGLRIMQQRAAALGGEIEIDSSDDGVTVEVVLPIPPLDQGIRNAQEDK